jgi:hypothetical protein
MEGEAGGESKREENRGEGGLTNGTIGGEKKSGGWNSCCPKNGLEKGVLILYAPEPGRGPRGGAGAWHERCVQAVSGVVAHCDKGAGD